MPAGRSLRSRDSSKSGKGDESAVDSMDYAQADAMEEDDTATASAYLTRVGVKRKAGDALITVHNTPKKRRRIRSGDDDSFPLQDVYCWLCHKECVSEGAVDCQACPRTYHVNCLHKQGMTDDIKDKDDNWTCPVCQSIAEAECETTRSWATRLLSPEKLAVLLCFTIRRMRHTDSEPFQHPVPKTLVQDYYDIVFCPMDLATLEKKVRKGSYASTEGFVADATWILHNSYIFNGSNCKYTNDAKLIMKICKFEISELELCPDCYRSSVIRQENWFSEPCTSPHCLVWAKLKGFPVWPAKSLRMSANNQMVDVRFFGEYDRAWIPIKDVLLMTEDYPFTKKNVKKYGLDTAIEELNDHIDRLKEKFGVFQYSAGKVDFKPEFLTNCPQFEGDPKTMSLRSQPHCRPMAAPSPTSSSIGPSEGRENDTRCSVSPGQSDDVSGVFTSEHNLQTTLDNPDALDELKRNDASLDDNLSCLERIKNCLQQEEDTHGSADSSPKPPSAVKSVSSPATERRAKKTLKNAASNPLENINSNSKNDPPSNAAYSSVVTAKLTNNVESTTAPKAANLSNLQPTHTSTPIGQTPKYRPILPKSSPQEDVVKEKVKEVVIVANTVAPIPPKAPSALAAAPPPAKAAKTVNTSIDTNIAGVFEKHAEKVTSFLQSTFETMWDELSTSMKRNNETSAPQEVGSTAAASAVSAASHDNSAELQSLRQQLSRLQWASQTSIDEVKKNTKLALTEMRKRLENEKMKVLTELMKKAEAEKAKAVQEAKSKQWCANCGKEAVFYCCWNTSYCDYPCQQQHWPKHQQTCAQIRPQQQMASRPSTSGHQPLSTQPIIANQNAQVFFEGGPGRLQQQPNLSSMLGPNAKGPPNVSLVRR